MRKAGIICPHKLVVGWGGGRDIVAAGAAVLSTFYLLMSHGPETKLCVSWTAYLKFVFLDQEFADIWQILGKSQQFSLEYFEPNNNECDKESNLGRIFLCYVKYTSGMVGILVLSN